MLFTLLGSALGFASSMLPQLLKMWQNKQDRLQNAQDNVQELAIIDRQIEQQKLQGAQKLQEVQVEANIREIASLHQHDAGLSGSPWVESLRASVRPIITYSFFGLFTFVKVHSALLYGTIALWDEPTQILFAAVISFWFGNRTVSKLSL